MNRFQGTISKDYDLVILALPFYDESQNKLAEVIADHYASPVVLDIGLGTGLTTRAIVQRNPQCVVMGVDNELLMIEQARNNLSSEVKRGSVQVHYSDALTYIQSLPDASVDVVASSYTIHNCPEEYRVLLGADIFRVLKPGGMFINNDKYGAEDRREYVKEMAEQIFRYDVLRDKGRDDLRRLWIEHEIEDGLPERIMWLGESLEQLKTVGFVNIRVVKRVGQYAIVAACKATPTKVVP
jgi:ubiquinone/menaquinone biosynthesis C-methylase UbiE